MAYAKVKSWNSGLFTTCSRWQRAFWCQGSHSWRRQLTSFSSTQPKSAKATALAEPQEKISFGINSLPFRLYTKSHIGKLFERFAPHLDARLFVAAAHVFPMRVNNYVAENLIDWSNIPNDPIFKLVFPQPAMLAEADLDRMLTAMAQPDQSRVILRNVAESIRATLNPHPAGQLQENVPKINSIAVPGMQHKYRETVLFFPTEGQFCHSFCTYCFRWAQFTAVGSDLQFQSKDSRLLAQYISLHPQARDVLLTGGDPMVMSATLLRNYISPLLTSPGTQHLDTIRIGTKSLAYWPYRYLSDPDSKDVLSLFEEVGKQGKHLTVQAHFSHPRELETPAVREAMRLIQMTGAKIRTQSPLIRGVNDSSETWARMWNLQVRLGAVPYYMFVERDTGARDYFSVPLTTAYDIFTRAYSSIAGTARTVRGPSMSASPGKVAVVGIVDIPHSVQPNIDQASPQAHSSEHSSKVFALKFFQARNPKWVNKLFFAKYDEKAIWFDDLKPAFGEKEFFFEREYQQLLADGARSGSSGQLEIGD